MHSDTNETALDQWRDVSIKLGTSLWGTYVFLSVHLVAGINQYLFLSLQFMMFGGH